MKTIARIQSVFPTKFGIPRQSGITDELSARIVFEPEYRDPEAVRGLEGFSHIWLIWEISENIREGWSPTVRPPRLGGNVRMGVFATRSPYRPNPIGLSCVRLGKIETDRKLGPVITVYGADLMDGTPIYDIKPYIPMADCRPEASSGFAGNTAKQGLNVEFPPELLRKVPEELRNSLVTILENDPRPHYHSDPERIYGFGFAGYEVKFSVDADHLKVIAIEDAERS